ncbi:MAG: sugar ABC transporter permease, partial [Thermodesulfobacteriota bacterium]
MKIKCHRRTIIAYIFVSPLVLIIFLFILVPILGTCINSFFQDIPYLPKKFVGMRNYLILIKNPDFWDALKFTIFFTLASVSLETILG